MDFKFDMNKIADKVFSKDYIVENKIEQPSEKKIVKTVEKIDHKIKNIDLDVDDLFEDLDLDIDDEQVSKPNHQTVQELFDGYIGEKSFVPNPYEYGPNATYRNLNEGVVYKKNEQNLWEAFVKDGKTGVQGPRGFAGGGTGVAEVQKIVTSATELLLSNINKSRIISIKDFGAVGDGITDDTSAFIQAINYAESNSATIKVQSGEYKLSSWVVKNVKNLNLIGDGYNNTKIIGPGIAYRNFINITSGGNIFLNSIDFELFDDVVYCSENINDIVVTDCRFSNLRNRAIYYIGWIGANIYITSSDSNTTEKKCKNILLSNNLVENCNGFVINAGFDSAIASTNTFKNLGRNLKIWKNSDNIQIYGVCFGYSDNINEKYAQAIMKTAIVNNNTIDTIRNECSAGYITTNGIVVISKSSTIVGNVIRSVSGVDGGNCEAIYNKAENIICSNNVIIDGTWKSCSIALKGSPSDLGPLGFNNVVSNNIIKQVSQSGDYGIYAFGCSYIDIFDNIIENTSDSAIIVDGDVESVNLYNNKILNCSASKIINYTTTQIYNCKIIGNKIFGNTRTSGSVFGIYFNGRKNSLTRIPWTILSGGTGYTTTPTVTVDGSIDPNPRVYIRDGVITSFSTTFIPVTYTGYPTIVVSGGGGTGASIATTALTSGTFKNISIRDNFIQICPVSALSECTIINFATDQTSATSTYDNIDICNNTVDFIGNQIPYHRVIGLSIPDNTISNYIGKFLIKDLYIYSQLKPNQHRIIAVGSDRDLSKYWKTYSSLIIKNILLNGVNFYVDTKMNMDDNKLVNMVNFTGTSAAVGEYVLCTIPGNLVVDKSYAVVPSILSGTTSAAKVELYVNNTGNSNYKLIDLNISATSASQIVSGACDGQVSNIKVIPQNGSWENALIMKVSNAGINGGSIKFITYFDQYF